MKFPVVRLPKLVWLSILASVLFVSLCYVASQWYYSRWDVAQLAFRGLGYGGSEGGLFTMEELQATLADDNYIGADDPANRSSELIENINAFETWMFKHPFVQYDEYSPEVLKNRLLAAEGDERIDVAWRIIDQYSHAHDFMIELMNLYGTERLPFERDSEPYQFIKQMIDGYCHILDTVEDPFQVEAFAKLQQDIEADALAWQNDPENIRIQREADRTRQTLAELDQMLKAYDNERNIKSSGTPSFASPWIMPLSSSADSNPDAAFSESTFQPFDVEDSLNDSLNAGVDDPGSDGEASYLTDNESEVNTDKKEATPFKLERFSNALQLIDQFGTEEGLRRLRESDPEMARQFESDKSRPGRERRPVPSRDVPDGGQSKSGSKD